MNPDAPLPDDVQALRREIAKYPTDDMRPARGICEIAAVLATALLHPVFVDVLHLRALFIDIALVGWLTYIGVRVLRERDTLQQFGFRREGVATAFAVTSVFGAAALTTMALIAAAHQGLVFRWEMALLLALYPVWGTMQQLLVQGIFVRTVVAMGTRGWPKLVTTVMAALLFGAVHLPDLKLTAATCAIGLVFTLVYLRWRNLWPLGVWHGWLGVFFYYWVLDRSPWREMVGTGG